MTVFEVVLVMVIVSIGAAMAYPQVQRMREKKQMTLAADSLQVVADAVRKYEDEHNVASNFWQPLNWDDLMDRLELKGYVREDEIQPDFEYSVDTANGRFLGKMMRNGVASNVANDWVWFQPSAVGRSQDRKFVGGSTFQRDLNSDQF